MREWCTNPIIIVSVLNDEQNIVTALDNGTNDYVTKTFRTGELLARVRSAIRKSIVEDNSPVLNCEDLVIDLAARMVKKNGITIKFAATEYTLLSVLARNEGKVLTHHYLLNKVWGPTYTEQSQYLRVFIAQLRKKIENDPNRPTHLLTESGVGYRFLAN